MTLLSNKNASAPNLWPEFYVPLKTADLETTSHCPHQQQQQQHQHPVEVDEAFAEGHDSQAVAAAAAHAGTHGPDMDGVGGIGGFAEARVEPPPRLLFAAGLTVTLAAFCLTVLALASAVLIPLMYSDEQEKYPIRLDYHNLYGYGIWLGFLLVGGGTLAMRAARDRTVKSFIRFYIVNWLAALACSCVAIARVVYYATVGYSDIVSVNMPHQRSQFRVQIACDCLTLVSLSMVDPAVVQYATLARRYWPLATAQQPADLVRINDDPSSPDS